MQMNEEKSRLLDTVIEGYLLDMKDSDAKVLLGYSHLLHKAWRPTLASLSISPQWRTLDVGSGLGILSFELAGHLPIKVWGVDLDPNYIDASREIESILRERGYFPPGAQVTFEVGDITCLPYESSRFDFVIVREVFLYLSDPEKAASELFRVMANSGQLFVEDTDDGLYITWPPPHPAMARLHQAVGRLQRSNGGDRESGRKVSGYLRSANFDITSAKLISEAHHLLESQVDHERQAILRQLVGARHKLVDSSTLTEDEFDQAISEYSTADLGEQFRIAGRVLLSARKP